MARRAPCRRVGRRLVRLASAPLYRVEPAFACLGRWRRLSRCYEGSAASARAWLEVVCVAYLLVRLRAELT
jgi:transposase